MDVIEQFTCGKYADPARNEDALFVGEHFVAIVDGATAKSETLWDGMRSGRFASQVLARSLAGLSGDATLDDAVEYLTAALRGEFAARNLVDAVTREPVLRPTAAIAMFSRARHEVWRIGDCPVQVAGVPWPAAKSVDELTAAARAYVLHAEIRRGRSVAELVAHDVGRDVITPLLRYQGLFQNEPERSEWGHCVIDGFAVPGWGRECLACAVGAEIVLGSDGYPELGPTLAATEALLQEALQEDPLCIARLRSTKGVYPGQVSFDDRSYVRFRS